MLVGGAYAFMHTTLKAWATEVALFSAALFAGGAFAIVVAAPLAEWAAFGMLFVLAILISVPLGVFGALARRRYARAQVTETRDRRV